MGPECSREVSRIAIADGIRHIEHGHIEVHQKRFCALHTAGSNIVLWIHTKRTFESAAKMVTADARRVGQIFDA